MNTDTGRIYTSEEMDWFNKARNDAARSMELSEYVQKYKPDLKELAEEMLLADQEKKLMEMEMPPTIEQMKRNPPKVGRNEPCPCGSGIKFKRCHWTGRYGQ
ncbi:MAG: hypothetical protein GWP19_09620 [Planctomycetia bacterium]|nr:hypothetical protein [Planctomycetia bacterium]